MKEPLRVPLSYRQQYTRAALVFIVAFVGTFLFCLAAIALFTP